MKSVRSFKSHKIETQISTKKHSFRKPDIISPEKKIQKNFDPIIEFKKPGII